MSEPKAVEAMTPAERNVEIARRKGWTTKTLGDAGYTVEELKPRLVWYDPERNSPRPLPDYASPALAWELLMELADARVPVNWEPGCSHEARAEAVKQAWIRHDREKADE